MIMIFQNIIDRIRLPFRKEKELYSSLRDIIGFYPHDIHYYKQALMHKSIGHREKGKPVNNERLEFLGDAVLDSVVGHIVYDHFPGKREGFLTNTRSKLVSRETLGRLSKEMGVIDLVLSNGRSSSHNSYMGGNAFEALVGAIYLDRGYEACMQFMEKKILKEIINIDKVAYKEVNFKSKLIEWGQKNRVEMGFELLSQEKDANGSPKFSYQVVIEGVKGEQGEGYSKKEAQQMASKLTLQRLRKEPQFIDAVFSAKGQRTKMEEEPVSIPEVAGETPQKEAASVRENEAEKKPERQTADKAPKAKGQPEKKSDETKSSDDFSLDDIDVSLKEQSREDIIAAAEAAAFAEQE